MPLSEHSVPDSDQPDDSTLPRPELNPLLNPILASHMGRWAEVYFTNPPERRESAILELLRELESDPAAASNTFPPVAETVLEEVIGISDASSPAQDEVVWIADASSARPEEVRIADASFSPQAAKPPSVCGLCGQSNPSEQLFCGMCGARLSICTISVGASSEPEKFHPVESAPRAFSDLPEVVSPTIRQIIEESGDPYSPPPVPSLSPARREPVAPRAAKNLGVVRVQPTPISNRRPLYVGASVVALLLVLLLYVGWRTKAGSSSATTQGLQPSSSQPETPPSQPVPSVIQGAQQHSKKLPAANRQPAATKIPANVGSSSATTPGLQPSSSQPETPPSQPVPSIIQGAQQHSKKLPAANRQPAATKTPATVGSATPMEGGSEELAIAQKYLNGTKSENHDNGEAAKWLWKAVGKQNMAATLLLSDLYLRGDGVPRSCDQARLLLDAAARKGKGQATERLRRLQALGCQ